MARAFSGVPNAGAPLRRSTFDVNAPYTTAAPGRTSSTSVMPASASAFCCTSAAARLTGVIAPIRVNGVITQGCPCSAIAISPSDIASSKRRGELTEMIVNRQGSSITCSRVRPRESAVISIASITRSRPIARQWNARSV